MATFDRVLGAVVVIGGLVVAIYRGGVQGLAGFVAGVLFGIVWLALGSLRDRVDALTATVAKLAPRDTASAEGARPKTDAAITPVKSEHLASVAEARAMMKAAQDHHFAKQFAAAKKVDADIVERFPDSKEAATARQQIQNLGSAT